MTAIGIDTHKATLAACAVDGLGLALDERTFRNDPAGHRALAAAMRFADHSEVELERLQSERALEKKRTTAL